jgi:hypothetical protein
MDSDDEKWINSQAGKLDITPLQVWWRPENKQICPFIFFLIWP